MKLLGRILGVLGIIGISSVDAADFASQAKTAEQWKKEAELACEEALRKGTIEALEEWHRKYSRWDSDSACLALAALDEYGPRNDEDEPPPRREGYGG